ncbi:MAG: hypothetical protein ABH887_02480 [bacterium]
MSKSGNDALLRRNPISGRVVVVAPDRQKSREQLARKIPRDWGKIKKGFVDGSECPFCLGHEAMTPPEVKSYRDKNTGPDESGWWVRVVSNLYPAINSSIPSDLIRAEIRGPFMVMPAFGYHYLIVNTPEHKDSLEEMSEAQFRELLHMWRDMILFAGSDRNIKYVFIFVNIGPLAGASQFHSHSQLVALPMIPTRIMTELRGARQYYEESAKCFFCEEIEWELRKQERIIAITDNFVAWCPFVSKTPYQIVISPRSHQGYFANISNYPLGEDALTEFAKLLQDVLFRLKKTLNMPDYNLYFHTTPTNQMEMPFFHWHCQIDPITEAIVAGFEKGSGVYMNPRSPENAAEDLRNAL